MSGSFLRRAKDTLIGNRAFYMTVLGIIVPVIVQNSISNFVNLLDNLMVGALGDAEMSGVAIANQLVFVFNLCVFGALSGAGIFGAQFYGAGDIKGLRDTFRIKALLSAALILLAACVFLCLDKPLISLFLKGDGDEGTRADMLRHSRDYLRVILLGLPAFALSQCYAGTLRETGETRLPMLAAIAAVLTNAALNYILIFGKLGFQPMGVRGAALATVISRYLELTIIALSTHRSADRHVFIRGAYRTFRVPAALWKDVLRTGTPLMFNEALWAIGMSTLTAVYSLCGLEVMSALSITSTIANLFNVVFISMGTAVSVMVGQALGADDYARARASVWKLIFFSVTSCVAAGALLAVFSPYIPRLYRGVTNDVRTIASAMLVASACAMPIHAFAHCTYFTLRSGGKTVITFLFDCAYTWVITVPLAYLLVKGLRWPILTVYPVMQCVDIVKCAIGYILIRRGVWIQNIARRHA